MPKITDYTENTSPNDADVFVEETSSGTRKIKFSSIVSGLLSKFLKSTTKSSLTAESRGTTSNREYPVGLDANGKMSVNVPWTSNSITVVNNCTSTSTTSALSAAQGKYLKSEIDDLNNDLSEFKDAHFLQTTVAWNNSNSADVTIPEMTASSSAIAMLNSVASVSITDVTPFAGGLRIRLTNTHTATHPVTIIWK